MSWASPEPGDWVRSRRLLAVSLSDRVLGEGLPPGTRGVVVERHGRRLLVAFDSGTSLVGVRVSVHDVRAMRPGGGLEAFAARARVRHVARLALVAALLLPVLQVVVLHLWFERSTDGITAALALAVVAGLQDSAAAALAEPGRALLHALVLAVLGRLAFGRKKG